ncbi:hybrid sensor histidine kinase/response regulator [Pannus brasiliensis CCIBt3594]|uniref:histidine kinase n=1 Tax=Pannus brasiliensis CCIBt3594 TaxID=1427578 RepID=A0AAW9QIF2_9CHRO
MNTSSILVIDDEPDNFDVIETLLNQQNYRLHYAVGGREAIDSLDTFAPDLILLDVMMPGMDGLEVCREIKALSRWQFIPIIMVTALSAKEDLARCLEAGADDFISKPVNRLELTARVRSTLRIKEQHDRLQEFSRLQRDTINILGKNLHELTDNIARGFPHELNTPLNGMIGTIEFLKDRFEEIDPATVRERLDRLDRSARRLEHLTQKFRVYLELELFASRQAEPERVRFSASTLARILRARADNRGRGEDLLLEIEEAEIAFPEDFLTTLLLELVENAFKFSEPNTVVTVKVGINGGKLHISVHDRGRGMTGEQIASIDTFRQFERELHEQQGIGMGLKIAGKIVEIAGGDLSISSVYGRETTVNLSLPIVGN